MAIEGFFRSNRGATPAPYVTAFIYFPRLDINHWVRFLIDTGADRTCLHFRDVNRLNIDQRRLRRNTLIPAQGIGGILTYYQEPAWLMFAENTGERIFCELDIRIPQYTAEPVMQGIPSLLGRDFLNRCAIHLDSALNLVQLEPRNVSGGFIQGTPVG